MAYDHELVSGPAGSGPRVDRAVALASPLPPA